MEKFITECADYLAESSNIGIAFVVGICGIVLAFLINLATALTVGDFVRYKKASNLIISGKTCAGIKKLRGGACRLNDISFDKTVQQPFMRSGVRKLPYTVFFAAAAFSFLSFLLSVSISGESRFSSAAAVAVLCLTTGFVFTGVSAGISFAAYKRAVKRFYRLTDVVDGEVVPLNSDGILPSTALLYERISDASKRKENSPETLNQLFTLLKYESNKIQTDSNKAKIKQAASLLNAAIKSE